MGLHIKTTVRLQSTPLDFVLTDKTFIAVDSSYILYTFLPGSYKSVARTSVLGKSERKLHPYSKLLSFGGADTVSISVEGGKKINIVKKNDGNFQSKEAFDIGEMPIVLNALSTNGKYLISANESGEAVLIDLSGGAQCCSFGKKGDYVCCATVSGSEKYLFISYFNKSALFYDIYNKNEISAIDTAGIVECALFVEGGRICAYATRSGHIGIYDYANKKLLTEKEHFRNWASTMALDESGKFIFIGTREGVLYVYSIEDDATILSRKFESCGGITKIAVKNRELIIGFVSSDIYIIDMGYHLDDCESFLVTKEYAKTLPLFEKNNFLVCLPSVAKKLEKEYEENKQKLLGMLAKNMINEAYELARPFMKIKKISNEFDFFASQTAEIVTFMDMIEKKDFEQAYKIAYKSDVIQSLYIFESLEREFDNRVNKALSLLEDSPENKAKAIELVRPFVKIPKKYEIIEQIFKNFDKFRISKELARQKKFAEYFNMCEKYAFLKNTETYKKVVFAGENLLVKAQEYENSGMFDEALRYLKILASFNPFAQKADSKIKELQARKNMVALCGGFDDDKITAVQIYKLVEDMPWLEYTDEFAEVHGKIKERISQYEQRANEIKPYEINEIFGELTEIKLLQGSFKSLMECIYLAEIKRNLRNDEVDWQKTFDLFYALFGQNREAVKLMNMLGVKTTEQSGRYGARYPKTILSMKTA